MGIDSPQVFRRVLVLLTDGDDNQSHVTRSEAIAAAQNSGAVIFTVSISIGAYPQGDKVLEMIASETGGDAYSGLTDADMPKVFGKIKGKIDQMYSVTYVPSEVSKTGHFRPVELKIASDKKAKVHAPKGYYAASPQ
jgi:VWFA-related protein